MPYYSLHCNRCETIFDKRMTFAEYDEFQEQKLRIECSTCGSEDTNTMIAGDIVVLDLTPKTIGSLADRNTKYRISEVAEEEAKKRETDIKAGKKVKPNEVTTWWEKPKRPEITKEVLNQRKEQKNEHVRKRATHPKSPGGRKDKRK